MIKKSAETVYTVFGRSGAQACKTIKDAAWIRFGDIVFFRYGFDSDDVLCTCKRDKAQYQRHSYPFYHQETCHYRRLFERYVRYVTAVLDSDDVRQ